MALERAKLEMETDIRERCDAQGTDDDGYVNAKNVFNYMKYGHRKYYIFIAPDRI